MTTKTYKIKSGSELELYINYLKSINWIIEPSLTDSEIQILAFIMLYNNKYSEISDKEKRFKFIFSSSIKKELRDEFNISSSKLETYLNKLRAKGALTSDNILEDVFCINLSEGILISFHLSNNADAVELTSHKEDVSAFKEVPKEQITEEISIEGEIEEERAPTIIIESDYNKRVMEETMKFLQDVKHH